MSKVYIFLAEGFEEIEGLTVVDILRRGGVDVVMVSIGDCLEVTGSHGICVKADARFEDTDFSGSECLVLPGGMPGTKHLGAHEGLTALLKTTAGEGGRIAAICAAPSVLGDLGLLDGKEATCYPGFEERLRGAAIRSDAVVVSGNVTTSRGMGTALPFALELLSQLKGEASAQTIQRNILFQR